VLRFRGTVVPGGTRLQARNEIVVDAVDKQGFHDMISR
jgi:hypothetical protein